MNVVKGDPTPEELAAVITAITAKLAATANGGSAGRTGGAGRKPASSWAAYWRTVRRPIQPGPGAWRRSAQPR